MSKNSDYGPQGFDGTPAAPDSTGFEDLLLTKDLLDQKQKVAEMVSAAEERLNGITTQCQKIAETLGVTVMSLDRITEKFNETGSKVYDMLEESKQYRDKGISLSPEAKDEVAKFTENLEIELNSLLSKKVDDFKSALQEIGSQHSQMVKAFRADLKMLKEQRSKLAADISSINGRIVFSRMAFWSLVAVFGAVLLFGGWGLYHFQSIPGNQDVLTYLVTTVLINGIFRVVCFFSNRKEKHEQPDDQRGNGPFSLSIGQCLYGLLIQMVLVVYGTWAIIGQGEARFLMYLLPVAVVTNLIWLIVRYMIVGYFHQN